MTDPIDGWIKAPPLQPFTLEEHQARWGLASRRLFTYDELRPGMLTAEHRFDFDSGLRLGITNEDHGGGYVYTHVSASALRPLEDALNQTYWRFGFGLAFRRLESLALGCASVITGIDRRRWNDRMLSKNKGVPNWFARVGS